MIYRRYATVCALLLAGLHLPLMGYEKVRTHSVEGPATGDAGMVSSAHPLATEAGLDILSAGGNAFDAAIAVAATLNVVEPMMSGMGGYGTILIYDAASSRARFLNCSGRIPKALDSDVFRAPTPEHKENRRGSQGRLDPG